MSKNNELQRARQARYIESLKAQGLTRITLVVPSDQDAINSVRDLASLLVNRHLHEGENDG